MSDDSFYLLLNAHHARIDFQVPAWAFGDSWIKVLHTSEPLPITRKRRSSPDDRLRVEGLAVVILHRVEMPWLR